MGNRAKPYCTCLTKDSLKKNPKLKRSLGAFREVKVKEEDLCVDCGHYVVWAVVNPAYNKPSRDARHSTKFENDQNFNWDLSSQSEWRVNRKVKAIALRSITWF